MGAEIVVAARVGNVLTTRVKTSTTAMKPLTRKQRMVPNPANRNDHDGRAVDAVAIIDSARMKTDP